ncbi:MAG: hypothetical protein IKX08_04950 [Lachnospiraceae bacterium]|nr:hypothetical protein [Lachnospiraceae bacterium]
MTGKTFLTKLIATIMVLIIAASFAAQTQVHAFEKTTEYKTKIKKVGLYKYELIINGRKINNSTITSTYGTMASLYGYEETRERIVTSFNYSTYQFYYSSYNYTDVDYLNDTFTKFFPKFNPDEYTSQQKNDMINIVYFTDFFLGRLLDIQGLGKTLYCNMF